MGKFQIKIKENNLNSNDNNLYLQEDILIEKLFGINAFQSSKNKTHKDSDLFGIFKGSKVKLKCRQYMNRKGGFNKLLGKDK